MSSSYHMEGKTLKQAVSVTCTLEKKVFAAGTFEGLWVLSFQREWKNCGILWSVGVFFTFLEKKRASKYSLKEADLFFYMYIFSLMCRKVY